MSFNLNDNLVPVEFRYSLFQKNKEYDIIVFDIFHPKIIVASISSGGQQANYMRFRAMAERDYLEDGLPCEIEYFQDFPAQAFKIAYSRYLWMDRKFFEYSKKAKDKPIVVRMTFVKKSNRNLDIKKIEVIHETE